MMTMIKYFMWILLLMSRAFDCQFLPERDYVTFVRVFAIANPSVVCNVRVPYSGGCNFRQYFFAILYPSYPLTSVQTFTEIVPGKPLCYGR